MGLFDKMFGRKGREPPKQGVSCPYCGKKEEAEKLSRWVFTNQPVYLKFPEWMFRYPCRYCGQDYWIVGSYDKLLHGKRMGV